MSGVLLILFRALMGPRRLDDLEIAFFGSKLASHSVLGAPVRLQPLEDCEMPGQGSRRARAFVPGASVGPRPLEDLEVPF